MEDQKLRYRKNVWEVINTLPNAGESHVIGSLRSRGNFIQKH